MFYTSNPALFTIVRTQEGRARFTFPSKHTMYIRGVGGTNEEHVGNLARTYWKELASRLKYAQQYLLRALFPLTWKHRFYSNYQCWLPISLLFTTKIHVLATIATRCHLRTYTSHNVLLTCRTSVTVAPFTGATFIFHFGANVENVWDQIARPKTGINHPAKLRAPWASISHSRGIYARKIPPFHPFFRTLDFRAFSHAPTTKTHTKRESGSLWSEKCWWAM